MTLTHIEWMQRTLALAEEAIERGEVPIACILVSKGEQIAHGYTHVSSWRSSVAHAETTMFLNAALKPDVDYSPLVLYTTLETCVMCLGAAMNCGVDTIVHAMPAAPDGGTPFVATMREAGRIVPDIVPHILQDEAERLMHTFLLRYPAHPGRPYVQSLFPDETLNAA